MALRYPSSPPKGNNSGQSDAPLLWPPSTSDRSCVTYIWASESRWQRAGRPVGLAIESSIRFQVGGIRQDLHGPSISVEFGHDSAHGTHAPRLFLSCHVQCQGQGLGAGLDGVRIHEHGINELPGGTCEPTE